MFFADRALQAMADKDSVLCVGLDPHFEHIPQFLKQGNEPDEAIEAFLTEIIDAVAPHCAFVKPNTAFFEVWGAEGWLVLERVSRHAREKGLLVIADAKRGDIGSTAATYAEAFLGEGRPFDAVTISPYLGQDGILPFVDVAAQTDKGVFVLVRTSNPSASEFQDLPVGDCLLHEEVARSVARIGEKVVGEAGFSAVGAVVGATEPEEIRILRSELPGQLLLIPGYGAQGGGAADVAAGFYENGKGAIVNSSRGIIFAGDGKDFALRAADAAERAKLELNAAIPHATR